MRKIDQLRFRSADSILARMQILPHVEHKMFGSQQYQILCELNKQIKMDITEMTICKDRQHRTWDEGVSV